MTVMVRALAVPAAREPRGIQWPAGGPFLRQSRRDKSLFMQGFIAFQLWCGPETFAAGRAGAAGRRAAVEPQVMNGMLPVGGERALPKGLWRIDTGDGNLELVPDTKTPRIRGLRIGLATLHTEGLVFRLAVVGGGVETANGERASRVFFAGRMPDGAFVDGDSEALAVVRIPREMPWSGAFRLVSYDAAGGFVADRSVVNPRVRECPDAPELNCVSSPRVLLVPEAIEEPDAPAGTLAMEARLGGRLAVAIGATELASAPVCRPGGAACGFAVRIRPVLVRSSPGGSSVFQGTPGAVREAFRERLERVLRPWESCGIRPLIDPVRIVDPPTKTLLSFGLPFGLVSDGRETLAIQLRHTATALALPAGMVPAAAAKYVHHALKELGVTTELVFRPRLAHEQHASAELLVGSLDGGNLRVERPGRMGLEATHVELRDGLEHFDDARAATGSQEERALLLPIVDTDAATVEVVAVPFFSDGRRLGESFVALDDPALVNVIVVDRAGLAASRTSHVVAHELGHVLLRTGDHPDEGSRDRPRLLMDSDASDGSRFGPRLVTRSECERVIHQGTSEPYRVLFPFEIPGG